MFPCLIAKADLSFPVLATSNPQTIGTDVVSATSLSTADLIKSKPITVSSSADGNSPFTSTLATELSSPYCSTRSFNCFLSVPSTVLLSLC